MSRASLLSPLSLSLALPLALSACSNDAIVALHDPPGGDLRDHPAYRFVKHRGRAVPRVAPRPTTKELRAEAKRAVTTSMVEAAQADEAARDEALDELRDAILARKSGAEKFASRVTNFSMQLNCTLKGKSYCRRQIELKFEHHLISKKELEEEIQATIDGYVADLETNDNRLLVDARADLDDFPQVGAPKLDVPEPLAGAHTKGVMRTLKESNERMVVGGIAGDLTALFVGRIMATTARRGVARGGAAAAGVAGSGVTLGTSLAAGFAVELLFYLFDDSEKKIRKRAERAMDELAVLVVEGDDEAAGLRDVLEAMAKDRQAARYEALDSAIDRGIR